MLFRSLADALEDIEQGFGAAARRWGYSASKSFDALRVLLTRYEPSNELHQSMFAAYRDLFGASVCANPIELSRAVEQAGRFQMSVYEQDYREMTRETWKRARVSFDNAYGEFRKVALAAWAARNAAAEAA